VLSSIQRRSNRCCVNGPWFEGQKEVAKLRNEVSKMQEEVTSKVRGATARALDAHAGLRRVSSRAGLCVQGVRTASLCAVRGGRAMLGGWIGLDALPWALALSGSRVGGRVAFFRFRFRVYFHRRKAAPSERGFATPHSPRPTFLDDYSRERTRGAIVCAARRPWFPLTLHQTPPPPRPVTSRSRHPAP